MILHFTTVPNIYFVIKQKPDRRNICIFIDPIKTLLSALVDDAVKYVFIKVQVDTKYKLL